MTDCSKEKYIGWPLQERPLLHPHSPTLRSEQRAPPSAMKLKALVHLAAACMALGKAPDSERKALLRGTKRDALVIEPTPICLGTVGKGPLLPECRVGNVCEASQADSEELEAWTAPGQERMRKAASIVRKIKELADRASADGQRKKRPAMLRKMLWKSLKLKNLVEESTSDIYRIFYDHAAESTYAYGSSLEDLAESLEDGSNAVPLLFGHAKDYEALLRLARSGKAYVLGQFKAHSEERAAFAQEIKALDFEECLWSNFASKIGRVMDILAGKGTASGAGDE